ncbi:MAG: O-antigen ligase family protein [Kiloniellales bacterium]
MTFRLITPPRPASVFAALAWAIPPVALFASRAMVILLLAGAGLLILDRDVRQQAQLVLRSPLALVLAGLVLWAGASVLWAPEPLGSLRLVAKLAGLFGAGLVLVSGALVVARDGARALYRPLSIAGLITVALLAVEWAGQARINTFLREASGGTTGYPLNLVNRGSVIASLLVWLTATAMARDRGPWGHPVVAPAFLATAFVVFLGLTMTVVPIALAFGAAFWLVVWVTRRRSVRILAVALAVLAAVAPLLPQLALHAATLGERMDALPLSLQHRLHMWAYVAERIAEHPWRGWGLDASRWFQAGHITIHDMLSPDLTVQLLPLHPHNGVLQVWLELGLPGAVLLTAIVALLLLGIERYSVSRAALASGVAVFATFGVIAGLSYGIWQSWWLATAWLIAAYAVILAGDRDAAGLPSRRASGTG